MGFAETLARLRKERGFSQTDVAEYLTSNSNKKYSLSSISNWETGYAMPPVEPFLLLCELYRVRDIQETFRGTKTEYRGMNKLNPLGVSRAEEYIAMLVQNALFAKAEELQEQPQRYIRLYAIPASAGTGSFLDSDDYEDLEVDETVPAEADFAVKVSGDSMTPRFIDGQIVFIKQQQVLQVGEIGIFLLNDEAYIKRLGQAELVSLNTKYDPIEINEYDSFRVFGKVIG